MWRERGLQMPVHTVGRGGRVFSGGSSESRGPGAEKVSSPRQLLLTGPQLGTAQQSDGRLHHSARLHGEISWL